MSMPNRFEPLRWSTIELKANKIFIDSIGSYKAMIYYRIESFIAISFNSKLLYKMIYYRIESLAHQQ